MPHPSFHLERDETIEELHAQARIFRHTRTGARLLSVSADDENKVFGIAFRTPPTDSTGLPHILEHAVLGGSHKYPLKEPFLELVKGSLKTFLNAFTYSDRTVYPVASTNLKDFYNLVDVYLDAVFFPLLEPHHLQQEGWHYELESADAPLTFKGVVFNEMKGAYSSPDSLFYKYGQQTLYPDTPYAHDSGGDPQRIPDLTYEAFRAFHAHYYHPANAYLYFYGDDDLEQRLHLAAGYLDRFDAQPVTSLTPLQPRFAAPQRHSFRYGLDAGSDLARKSMLSLDWLLPEKDDANLNMALSILSYALIGTQASPLRKRLVDSGLGEDVIGGLSAGLRQMSFSAGFKNADASDINKAEALILATLEEIAAEGFDEEMVEAALNSTEFSLRENNTGGAPRGLSLYLRALNTWLYDGDPFAMLRYEAPLAWTRAASQDRSFLPSLIRSHLLDNPHRVTVVLHPDVQYGPELEAMEQARLREARAAMSEADVESTVHLTHELRRLQAQPDSPELLESLPSLALDDLEREQRRIPLAVERVGDATLLYHDLFTNGIVYLTLAFDMRALPQHLLPWADIFSQCLTQMGTAREDYVKLSQRIGRKTGGVGASTMVSAIQGRPDAGAWFTVGGKATLAHAGDLLDILRDILGTARVDNRERLRQIVLRTKARMEAGLVPSGHSIVDGRLRASLSAAGWAGEQLDGIDNLFFHRRLADQIDDDHDQVVANLEAVRRALLSRIGVVANVTLDEGSMAAFRPALTAFLQELPAVHAQPQIWQPSTYPEYEGLALPAQVNYVGKGANLYDAGYVYHGSQIVLSNLLRTGYLWEKIRVQGGAYGAFANFSRHSGAFTLVSYRDPNLAATLDVYDKAAAWLRGVELSDLERTRAIIGAISSYDPYMLPDAKGGVSMRRYLLGDSDEDVQRVREEILSTTVRHIRDFGDVLQAAMEKARVVVLGSSEALAAANQERDWLSVLKVL